MATKPKAPELSEEEKAAAALAAEAEAKRQEEQAAYHAEIEAQGHIRRLQNQLAADQAIELLALQHPPVADILVRLKSAQARIAELEAQIAK